MKNATLLIVLVVTLALCVTAALPARHQRKITATPDPAVNGHGYVFQATQVVSAGVGTLSRYFMETTGFPRFRVSFFNKSTDGVAGLAYRVGAFSIVEYIDDGTHDFRGKPRSVIQRIDFQNIVASAWSTMTLATSVIGGYNVYTVTSTLTSTTPKSSTRTFTLEFSASISEQTVQQTLNTTLSPNALKFNFVINNWPWYSNSSKLGLVIGCMSAELFSDGLNPYPLTNSVEGMITMGGDPNMGFAWATEVAVNFPSIPSASVPIVQSPLWSDVDFVNYTDSDLVAGEEHHGFFFTFNTNAQPNSINWDPTASLPDNSQGSSSSGAFVTPRFVLIAIAIVMAVIISIVFRAD